MASGQCRMNFLKGTNPKMHSDKCTPKEILNLTPLYAEFTQVTYTLNVTMAFSQKEKKIKIKKN